MIITRHNYEEYFILYMDNELNSEDRRRVELFVQENPDLKQELDWLLQSRLAPDTSLVFDNKEQLMKTSGAGLINITNYEEWLLLYTDNELTAEQKIAVEKFAAGYPAIKKELEILQKTKLQPEQEIIFPGKELLYRKEEKARVIAINWRKIAVAAALLIAISTIAFVVFNNKSDDTNNGIGSNNQSDIKSMHENPVDQQTPKVTSKSNQALAGNSNEKTANETAQINNPVVTTDKKVVAPKEKNIQPSVLPINEDAPVIADNNKEKKKTNDLPEPAYNPNVNRSIEQNNPIAKNDLQPEESLTISKETKQVPVVTPDNGQPLDNVIAAASRESLDPADAEQPGKKNKLRGFFRKVTRTFEKRTNIKATDDEDRLLLGGLAIKL